MTRDDARVEALRERNFRLLFSSSTIPVRSSPSHALSPPAKTATRPWPASSATCITDAAETQSPPS